MNRIESAFTGVVGAARQLKTSKAGKPWVSFSVRIGDADAAQWVQVAAFGSAAETAAKLVKGGNCYVEGTLTLRIWTTEAGIERHGLNVGAWRVEALGQIGKRRPPKAKAEVQIASEPRMHCPHPSEGKMPPLDTGGDPIPF